MRNVPGQIRRVVKLEKGWEAPLRLGLLIAAGGTYADTYESRYAVASEWTGLLLSSIGLHFVTSLTLPRKVDDNRTTDCNLGCCGSRCCIHGASSQHGSDARILASSALHPGSA